MSNPYSMEVAFDDLYEDAHPSDGASALLSAAKAYRIAPPPMVFDVLGNAPADCSFTVAGHDCVGAEPLPRYPMYSGLRRQYAAAIPGPKFMRVDTPDSYADFRDSRRLPYIEDFDAAYSAEDSASLDLETPPDILGALSRIYVGGSRIVLPRALRRKADAWLDGTEVLVTIAVPTRKGIRYMTAGSPVSRHVDELAIAAEKIDMHPDVAAPVIAEAAPVVGAASLLPQLCGAYPAMLACRHDVPVLGLLSANANADMAACMGLLQAAHAGHTQAKAEIALMAREGLAKTVGEAEERLVQARQAARRLP